MLQESRNAFYIGGGGGGKDGEGTARKHSQEIKYVQVKPLNIPTKCVI